MLNELSNEQSFILNKVVNKKLVQYFRVQQRQECIPASQ